MQVRHETQDRQGQGLAWILQNRTLRRHAGNVATTMSCLPKIYHGIPVIDSTCIDQSILNLKIRKVQIGGMDVSLAFRNSSQRGKLVTLKLVLSNLVIVF